MLGLALCFKIQLTAAKKGKEMLTIKIIFLKGKEMLNIKIIFFHQNEDKLKKKAQKFHRIISTLKLKDMTQVYCKKKKKKWAH